MITLHLELFGLALHLELGRANPDNGTDPGDCTTAPAGPVGFVGWDRPWITGVPE